MVGMNYGPGGSVFTNEIYENGTGVEVQGYRLMISENSIYCNETIGISLAGCRQ